MPAIKDTLIQRLKNSPHYRWIILANVSIGTFMSSLDSSVVNVALPTMSASLKTDLSTLQWVVTAYLLTISSLLLIAGRAADLLGRKKVYSFGFLIFTLGSALCSAAPNIWVLIGARIIQATGAAMLMANSAAIITGVFGLAERGRALGLIGTVVALGSLTGPALGGILVGLTGWRSIFYINIPIGIIGYLASQIIIPADAVRKTDEKFDFRGALLFAFGIISILVAISNGQGWGWSSTPIISGFILGFAFLAFFFYTERRVRYPMIDLSLFHNRPFLIGNLTSFLSFTAMFSNVMLMPFYLQYVLNYSPSKVGLVMTAFPLVMAVVAPISGYVSDKTGPLALTTGGLLISASSFLYMSTLSADSSFRQIIIGPLLTGLGASLFNSPNNNSVMSSVSRSKLGIAGGINALLRNIGMAVGISLSVSLFQNRQAAALAETPTPSATQQTQAFVAAYNTVMLAAAGIALVAALISFSRKNYLKPQQSQSKE